MTLPQGLRRLDRTRGLELVFGVILPGILFGPFLCFALLGMLLTVATSKAPVPESTLEFMGIVAAMIVGGVSALFALGSTVLLDPGMLQRRRWLRIGIVIALLGGIGVAGYVLWAQRASLAWSLGSPLRAGSLWILLPGLVALAGPIVVALRRLPALIGIRRAPTV